jgi:hypothetical protein
MMSQNDHLDVCHLCQRELGPGEQLYACEVCGVDCCAGCSDGWDGDKEEDVAFAGMALEVVCDCCLDGGFVPPEGCTARG